MNWYRLFKRANNDPLTYIRMLMEDPQNGIKAQLNAFMRDPSVSKFFTDHALQQKFVSVTAAIQKCIDLSSKFQDYAAATERLRAAYQLLNELCGEMSRRAGGDFMSNQRVKTICQDMRDVFSELRKLVGMTSKSPAQQQPPPPGAHTGPVPFRQPMPPQAVPQQSYRQQRPVA